MAELIKTLESYPEAGLLSRQALERKFSLPKTQTAEVAWWDPREQKNRCDKLIDRVDRGNLQSYWGTGGRYPPLSWPGL